MNENETVLRKALLFIPNTEENVNYCEEANILGLITSEAIQVEVLLKDEEKELVAHELYDVYINQKFVSSDVSGEWLTLIK